MTMREPYARRCEVWQRAENDAVRMEGRRSEGSIPGMWDHPEMVELMLQQRLEADSLHAIHGEERVRLMIAIRRERRAKEADE
jgi:hypothetical protein